ncbi:hypothetical protein DR864_10735 [Runella rosea]|uniref:Uncharacterized protein n=1 Tax=Runella rosea TaxID=2259595 RepID=A0A344THR2_9BACT|nr:hypothetical protein [Runella rosea]AXE18183.1 hypothetical protein DR864_10735 [Runella rosea]
MKKKFASPATFLAALLCFLLPFATVRCTDNPTPLGQLSGIQFVVGENLVKETNMTNEKNGPVAKDVIVDSDWARLAFLMGLLGLAVAFMKIPNRIKRKIATITALSGIVCLVSMWIFSDAWYRSQNMPLVFEYRFGFYFALGGFIAAAMVNWLQKTETVPERPAEMPTSQVEYL